MNSDDELAQRGRAIFERLRENSAEAPEGQESLSGDESGASADPSSEDVVGLSIPSPETATDDASPAESEDLPTADAGEPEAQESTGGADGNEDAEDPAAVEPVDVAVNDAGAGVADSPEPSADHGEGGGEESDPDVDDEAETSARERPDSGPAGAGVADPAEPDAEQGDGGGEESHLDDGGAGETSASEAASERLDSSPAADPPVAVVGEADAVIASVDSLDEPVVADDGEVPQLVAEQPASFARPLPRVLAIANQKGGVGKTTTAVNLSAALAELGYRVLVIDLDPQGNATTGLGVNPRNLESSVYDVLMHDVPLEDCIEPTSLRNLFVVPATIDLAGAEIELVPSFSRELKLRKALEGVIDDFDFVLIDCPPSLGLITVNGLAAATEVVVPIQCEYYALEGLGQLLRNVNLVQGNLNPKLEVSAIILTMYDARTKLADQVANEVRTHFGTKVCRNIVPRTVRLSEAPSFGQPIIVFDPSSRGAIAYRELAKEVSGGAPQRVG